MDAYFSEIYGKRWPGLKEALRGDVRHVALENAFSYHLETQREACIKRNLGDKSRGFKVKSVRVHSYFGGSQGDQGYPKPASDSNGLKCWYWMDLASLLPALALGIDKDDAVLDVCAAPGGKSLVLALELFGGKSVEGKGSLTLNEVEGSRRKRLARVIGEYLPKDLKLKSKVKLTAWDGTKLREHNTYDKILVDAPCSSERHVLKQQRSRPALTSTSSSAPVIDRWSPKGCKTFAKLQYGILKSALLCLKPRGRLVYSTCSISAIENDLVIDKVLEKFGSWVNVVKGSGFEDDMATLKQLGCEPTKHGWTMFPDKSKFGPIFWCLLERSGGGGGGGEQSTGDSS